MSDIENNDHTLKVGDLVIYSPHYRDGDGSWIMSGDLGVVLETKSINEKNYQVVKVKWIDDGVDMVDMSSEVLKKIVLDKVK